MLWGDDMENIDREFLHSQSRIVDRLLQVEKDFDRVQDDAKRMTQDIESAKRDIVSVRTAIETMFNDFLKPDNNERGAG